MSGLTEEQRQRIEENKRKAQARLAEKQAKVIKASHPQIQRFKSAHTDTAKLGPVTSITACQRRDYRACDRVVPPDPNAIPNEKSNSDVVQPKSVTSDSFKIQTQAKSSAPAVNTLASTVKLSTVSAKTFYHANHDNGSSNRQKPPSSAQPKTTPTRLNFSKPDVTGKRRPNSGFCTNNGIAVLHREVVSVRKPSLLAGVKGRCVLSSRQNFRVEAGFHTVMVEVFKSMKTKQYDAATKMWSFKLEEYDSLMQRLRGLRPEVDIEPLPSAVKTIFRAQFCGKYPPNEIPEADLSSVDPILQQSLMPFQRTGVSFGVMRKGRVLIADDMGLGKTIQAICLACVYRHEWPLLVVVPSSVRYDWAEQLRRWVPSLDPQSIVVVTKGKDRCTSGSVVVISYDLLSRKLEELKHRHFEVIIMDESHFLKNAKTVRTKAALPLLQSARRVILLSGTPALSRPSELYTQIIAVSPGLFKFHDYGVRYCDGKELTWGWDFSGCSNMGELQLLLEEKLMIRRLKREVLSQLPSKVRRMVLLDPSSIKISKHLKEASSTLNYKDLKGMEKRGKLLDYFHETSRAKVNAVRDYVLDLLESGQKFLVFAHHQEMLNNVETSLENKMSGCQIRIDGKTPSERRKYFCDKFQTSDSVRVALLSITAANAGLNLTAASLVVFAELFWNPGILVQAEDRAHRIGQQDSVSVHYLVAPGTADDHIWPLVQNKLSVLGKAGLSKEDFSEADTCSVKSSKQSDLRDFFEESFFEEDDSLLENQGEVNSDDRNMLSERQTTSEPDVFVKKTPTKQTGIQQFFKHEPGISVGGQQCAVSGDIKQWEFTPDEFDDCDWIDDIVAWEENDGQPVNKKPKL